MLTVLEIGKGEPETKIKYPYLITQPLFVVKGTLYNSKARFLRTAFLFNLYLEKLNWNKR